jgi:hypothetical protein
MATPVVEADSAVAVQPETSNSDGVEAARGRRAGVVQKVQGWLRRVVRPDRKAFLP